MTAVLLSKSLLRDALEHRQAQDEEDDAADQEQEE
jgi:hypothetical protein